MAKKVRNIRRHSAAGIVDIPSQLYGTSRMADLWHLHISSDYKLIVSPMVISSIGLKLFQSAKLATL